MCVNVCCRLAVNADDGQWLGQFIASLRNKGGPLTGEERNVNDLGGVI